MRRSWWLVVDWALGTLAFAASVAAVAPAAPAPAPAPNWQVVEPQAPWRAGQWPLVVALAEPTADLAALRDSYSRLTQVRGALLLVLRAGDEALLDRAVAAARAQYPLLPTAVLAAAGETADWARGVALRRPELVSGLLSIDATAAPPPTPPGRKELKVVLLVSKPERAEANQSLADGLLRLAVSCALQRLGPSELPRWTGAALSQLLPPPPALTELTDPATHTKLHAPPGWEFRRSDFGLATARPTAALDGLRVEVATGLLGKRSFESYVESTLQALKADGIDLVESTRITPPDAQTLAHAFYFIDHRKAGIEPSVYWVQVGQGNRIVSFRCVAPRAELADRFDEIRQLALSVEFEDEPVRPTGEARKER